MRAEWSVLCGALQQPSVQKPQFEEPLNNKTWLRCALSPSEACAPLMTSPSALNYAARVAYQHHTLPKHFGRAGTCSFIAVCVFLVDC